MIRNELSNLKVMVRLIPYRSDDMMLTTRTILELMKKIYDRYGNSLTELMPVEDASKSLQGVQELVRKSKYFFQFVFIFILTLIFHRIILNH